MENQILNKIIKNKISQLIELKEYYSNPEKCLNDLQAGEIKKELKNAIKECKHFISVIDEKNGKSLLDKITSNNSKNAYNEIIEIDIMDTTRISELKTELSKLLNSFNILQSDYDKLDVKDPDKQLDEMIDKFNKEKERKNIKENDQKLNLDYETYRNMLPKKLNNLSINEKLIELNAILINVKQGNLTEIDETDPNTIRIINANFYKASFEEEDWYFPNDFINLQIKPEILIEYLQLEIEKFEKQKEFAVLNNESVLAKISEIDLKAMKLAVKNGRNSKSEEGKLSPKVGAAIVKDGKILGVAFRGQNGEGDHAEYTLFEKVLQGKDVSGATIYTTLEPCTHRNNHKPCTDWIIEKGIKHVFIGFLDPNPKIYNNGCKKLKATGIDVSYFPSELREEIMDDNTKFIKQFNANPNLSGKATFDYTNNNGLYIIGNNEMIFETMWSTAGEGRIHAYNDPDTIKKISIADGCHEFTEIKDGSIYDSSSRTRTIQNGEILILENTNGFFAVIKIIEVKTKQNTGSINELNFEYFILDNKTSDFSPY